MEWLGIAPVLETAAQQTSSILQSNAGGAMSQY